MSKSEERRIRKEGKTQERLGTGRRRGVRRLARRWGLYTALGLLVAGGGALVVTQAVTAKVYPPSGMQDHVESYPPCRICGQPTDRPGILVQYNCASCPEVVAKLTRIVERYPRGVYLAPYPRMSPRIALTTFGRLETMEEVDEARIVAFIEKHL